MSLPPPSSCTSLPTTKGMKLNSTSKQPPSPLSRNNSQIMETASLAEKATECPVCHEYYKEPKILPCAHLLCRNCLANWMKTNKKAQCPLCRCTVVDPKDCEVKSFDDVADQLTTDDVMSETVDNMKIFNQKRVCYVHKHVKAKSFCLNCRFMLCKTCAEAHVKIPATSGHKLEDLEKLTLESLISSGQSMCSAHPDMTCEHYCVMHDVLICNECVYSKHRDCPEVSWIKEMFEKYKRSLSQMDNRLRVVESALNHVVAEVEGGFVTLEQNTKDAFAQIDAACDRLVLSIENCRKRLKKLMQDDNDSIMTETCKHKESLDYKRGLVISHRSLINRIQLSASGTSLISMVPRLNKCVNGLDLSVPSLSDWKSLFTTKLTIDEKVISCIEVELAKLGELTVSSSLAQEQIVWRFHPNYGQNIVLRNHDMAAEAKDMYYGTVFSSEPIKVNMLYEVQVEETNTQYNGTDVGFGLITEDPAIITNLPAYSIGLQSAIVVFYDGIYVKQERTPHNVGDVYNTFKVGSRIGVMVDGAQCLHVYVDGKDQGVVYPDVHMPCWAMFELFLFLRKVTALPLTCVP